MQVPAFRERQALPVLTLALAPEIPGTLRLNREVLNAFQQSTLNERIIGEADSPIFTEVSVSSGRLVGIAGGRTVTTRYGQLHADGSGVLMFNLDPRIDDVAVKIYPPQFLCWLVTLGRHCRDRAGASGAVSIRVRLLADAGYTSVNPMDAHPDDSTLQLVDLNGWNFGRPAESALGAADAFVDDVADVGANLISVASLLADEAFHSFGRPEVELITADGRIVTKLWGPFSSEITSWAQRTGLL